MFLRKLSFWLFCLAITFVLIPFGLRYIFTVPIFYLLACALAGCTFGWYGTRLYDWWTNARNSS